MFHFLFNLIGGETGSMVALSLTIIAGSFLFEDLTAIIVGVLAADGLVPIPLALPSLYVGTILSDLGLYCLGWLARTHPRLARYVDHEFIAPFRVWLESRFILTVFSARFVLGSRIPTYTASGFFRLPFSTFVRTVIVACTIWITFLFFVSYWFGNLTSHWLGPVRWGVALVFIAILFFVGRHNLLAYRAKKNEMKASEELS